MKLYTDGSCIPNPGMMTWGAVLEDQPGHFLTQSGVLWEGTNNQAEFMAVLNALRMVPNNSVVNHRTDSTLVSGAFNGFKIKEPKLVDIISEINLVCKERGIKFSSVVYHGLEVEQAHYLAQAMHNEPIEPVHIMPEPGPAHINIEHLIMLLRELQERNTQFMRCSSNSDFISLIREILADIGENPPLSG